MSTFAARHTSCRLLSSVIVTFDMAAEPEQRDGGAWCQRLRRGVGGAEVEQGGGGGGSGGSGGSVDRVAFSHRHSRSSTMLEAIRRIKRHRIVAENNGGGDGGHGGRRRGRSTGIRRAADEDRDDAANDDAFGADVEHEHDHDQANANAVAPAGFHSGDGTFRLLLVGADRVEGTSPLETADVFKGLLRRSRRGRGRIVGGNGIGKGEREGGSGGGGGGGGEGGSPRGRGGIQNEVTASANDASGADEPEELEEDEDAMEGIDRVDILLVGPNVMLDEGVEEGVFHTVPSAQKTRELSPRGGDEHRPIELRVAYHVGLYHDMKRPDDDDDDDDDEGIIAAGDKNNDEGHRESIIATTVDGFSPDLAVAFNAGMWGYSPDEWRPTVERVLHEDGCPLVVTGYTLEVGARTITERHHSFIHSFIQSLNFDFFVFLFILVYSYIKLYKLVGWMYG